MQQIQLNKREALKQDTQCDKCMLMYFGNWLLISGKQQYTLLMSLANKLFCYTHTHVESSSKRMEAHVCSENSCFGQFCLFTIICHINFYYIGKQFVWAKQLEIWL